MARKRLAKPASVASDPWRSAKWDEVVEGRDFDQSDAPAVALLVCWCQVAEQCMDDITAGGGVQVCYADGAGDVKAVPQVAAMKQASAEIRALSKQLGIGGARGAGKAARQAGGASVLQLVRAQHEEAARKAAGA